MADDDEQTYVVLDGVGAVSTAPFVFHAVAQQLEHQLDRYRDTLVLGLGVIAAGLAGLAFLLVEKATPLDLGFAVLYVIAAGISAIALSIDWDAKDAPKPSFANTYAENPPLARATATGAVLLAISANEPKLARKMKLLRFALTMTVVVSFCGVTAKVIELGAHEHNHQGDNRTTVRAATQTCAKKAVRSGRNCASGANGRNRQRR